MSGRRLLGAGLAAALVGSNVYWWRRGVDGGRTDAGGAGPVASGEAAGTSDVLDELSASLGTDVADLPDRLEGMDRRVRHLEEGVDRLWGRCVEDWWDHAVLSEIRPADPFAVHATVSVHDSVAAVGSNPLERLGRFAVSAENCLFVAVDPDEGRFVVTVGEGLRSTFDAAGVAGEITADTASGSGGSADLAQGGGPDAAAVVDAIDRWFDDRRSETPFEDNAVRASFTV
jgi:alanyl-tRNA synthetase